MKVVTAKEMSRIEDIACSEGACEKTFMECAGRGIANRTKIFIQAHGYDQKVTLLCGKGNNAGDAYVAGLYLLQEGYEVHSLQLSPLKTCSPLCQENAQKFQSLGKIVWIQNEEEIQLPPTGVLLDGLFGTGFHGKPQGLFKHAIQLMNQSKLPTLSIDIPSGLNGNTGETVETAVHAASTFFLGLPKTGFFIRNGWNSVGDLNHVDFGLNSSYIEQAQENFQKLSLFDIQNLLPHYHRNQNKYEAGYVVGLAGSHGMSGAALLSSYCALRGGAGIVRLFFPQHMQTEMVGCPFELITQGYTLEDKDSILSEINKSSASYLGPGLGASEESITLFNMLLPHIETPCVLDADALNIFSSFPQKLPSQTVMTPHLGEMHRLLGLQKKNTLDLHFLDSCQAFTEKHQVTLVLKGGPTFVLHPYSHITVCTEGSPGMATAGSGDVLTGLIAALMAQGLSGKNAALLAVTLHGIAGEYCSETIGPRSMIASDLIEALPIAFEALNDPRSPV